MENKTIERIDALKDKILKRAEKFLADDSKAIPCEHLHGVADIIMDMAKTEKYIVKTLMMSEEKHEHEHGAEM